MATQQTNPTHADRAYSWLKRDIIQGVWEADSRLAVKQLSAHYDIGASPIREALARLGGEDLVRVLGNRGFRVPPIDIADLWDVTNTRVLVETEALRESIANGDENWEAEVVAAYYRLEKIDSQGARKFSEWDQRNERFHAALVAACPSRWLHRMRVILYEQHRRYRFLSAQQQAPTGRNIAAEHQALRTAALDRDTETAVQVLSVHIERTAHIVEQVLAEGASVASKP